MRIVETIHAKQRYYLVFDGMDIIFKHESKSECERFINELKD